MTKLRGVLLLLFAGSAWTYGQLIQLKGTLVSGIAYYDNGKGRPKKPAAGVQLYCAAGKYESDVYDVQAIWGEDCTSGIPSRPGPVGLFHFYNPNQLMNGISIMHRLGETGQCNNTDPTRGQFYSRFYSPAIRDQGFEVKASFILHPTYQPFASIQEAVEQVADIVAVHYFLSHGLGRAEKSRINGELVRAAIEREVSIVRDSLIDNPPEDQSTERAMHQLTVLLGDRRMKNGEQAVSVWEWLPKRQEFWRERGQNWAREKKDWDKTF